MTHEQYQSPIDACVRCAEECQHCASACLNERNVSDLAECIRLDLDCAGVCLGAIPFMSRGSRFVGEVCRVCADICDACAAECQKHATHMEHCRRCAEACRRCAEECRNIAGVAV